MLGLQLQRNSLTSWLRQARGVDWEVGEVIDAGRRLVDGGNVELGRAPKSSFAPGYIGGAAECTLEWYDGRLAMSDL